MEKSNRAWSKSKTGPVTPVIIKGQPANKAQRIPETDETIIVSVIPIRFEVVSPRIPPKAGMNKQINKWIIGIKSFKLFVTLGYMYYLPIAPERQAKKIKIAAANTCPSKPSLISDQ